MPLAEKLLDILSGFNLFAAIDIHNNSGNNPPHGCINILSKENFSLAKMFSPLVLYFTKPESTLGIRMSPVCPTVTLECGIENNNFGSKMAYEFLLKLLKTEKISGFSNEDQNYYHVESIIKVP